MQQRLSWRSLEGAHPTMTPVAAAKKGHHDDPHAFLATIGEDKKFVLFPKKQTICARGYR
jgi:hypothetical protein